MEKKLTPVECVVFRTHHRTLGDRSVQFVSYKEAWPVYVDNKPVNEFHFINDCIVHFQTIWTALGITWTKTIDSRK